MATTLNNPSGREVRVPDEQVDDLLKEGFERVPEPEPDGTEDADSPESTDEDESPEEPEEAESQNDGDGETDIADALESDDYQTMRSVLADRIEESTSGMSKAEIRERLEEIV